MIKLGLNLWFIGIKHLIKLQRLVGAEFSPLYTQIKPVFEFVYLFIDSELLW